MATYIKGSILESRQLCLSLAVLIAFCFTCAAEVVPSINSALELASFPKKLKMQLIISCVIDFIGALTVKQLVIYIWNRDLWIAQKCRSDRLHSVHISFTAACEEEIVLRQKARKNLRYTILFACALSILIFHALI